MYQTTLIIGGTGSLGKGLVRELLKKTNQRIRILARNEAQMVQTMQEIDNPRAEMVLGDIRDSRILRQALEGVHMVFHLAALKHVPVCETMPFEAIATNVVGTENVINAAIENEVEKVVYVSTDKAVNADCTYGSTKYLGEKLVLSADRKGKTRFTVFRGGNLLGSSGSVIPLFKRQIRESGKVFLTDERMNRFFISIPKAARLLTEIAEKSAGGEIFIPDMPSLKIRDIARYLLLKNDLGEEKILVRGIRPGEKISEELFSRNEQQYLYRFSEDLYVILPKDEHGWVVNGLVKKWESFAGVSEEAQISFEETVRFLEEEGV